MESNNNLTSYIETTISHWVKTNFDSQEVNEPSWNIKELSSYLAKELSKREEKKKNLVPHELTVLFKTDCDESRVVSRVERTIAQFDGEIITEENAGNKRLAYQIRNEDYAIYYYFNILIPKDSPAKLSASLNINDDVLRYLLVKEDTRRR